jgi:hypothetical protein
VKELNAPAMSQAMAAASAKMNAQGEPTTSGARAAIRRTIMPAGILQLRASEAPCTRIRAPGGETFALIPLDKRLGAHQEVSFR